jgi:hypothetical protein
MRRMSRSWRKLAAPTLLVLALAATLGPAFTVLAASRMCGEMAAGAATAPADLPCQWLTPASCCADMASATPPPAFAPPPAAGWLAAAAPSAPTALRAPARHETPRGDRLAFATVVLLL